MQRLQDWLALAEAHAASHAALGAVALQASTLRASTLRASMIEGSTLEASTLEASTLDAIMRMRPAADMLPFGVQGQILVNLALRSTYPLAGLPRPDYGEYPDTPDGLRARIARAETLLRALAPESFADAAQRQVVDRAGDADIALPGERFLREFALPNLYFHLTAAYIALRGAGVPLGKADFDGLHVYPLPPGREAGPA